jgi:hypothetical protein
LVVLTLLLAFFLYAVFLVTEIWIFGKVIAENLSEEEIKGLKQMFNNMDTDKSGTITLEELKTGLSRLGSKLTEIEIKQLMDAVSAVNLSHYPVISLLTETNKLFIVYIYSSFILQEINHVSSYIISLWLMYLFIYFFLSG